MWWRLAPTAKLTNLYWQFYCLTHTCSAFVNLAVVRTDQRVRRTRLPAIKPFERSPVPATMRFFDRIMTDRMAISPSTM